MKDRSESTTDDPELASDALFADEEPDWLELKRALNEAIWMKAPGNTTLAQAEEAACRAIGYLNECFQANAAAHLLGHEEGTTNYEEM